MFSVISNLIAKLSALMQISVLISPAAQLQNYFLIKFLDFRIIF